MDRIKKTTTTQQQAVPIDQFLIFTQNDPAPSWVFPTWSSSSDPVAQGKKVFLEHVTLKNHKEQILLYSQIQPLLKNLVSN